MNGFTDAQRERILGLGVREDQLAALGQGVAVAYYFPTTSAPAIAILQIRGESLLSGIFEITDPGGGVLSFLRFRNASFDLAMVLELSEVEFFGGEVLNDKLAELLRRQGFRPGQVRAPDELGNDLMNVLARVFPVPGPEES
jgi:hypothetical protein